MPKTITLDDAEISFLNEIMPKIAINPLEPNASLYLGAIVSLNDKLKAHESGIISPVSDEPTPEPDPDLPTPEIAG